MRAHTSHGSALVVALFFVACTVESSDDNPFGSGTPVTSSPPATDTGDATEGAGSGTAGASTGVAESTGVVDEDSSGPPPTTGMPADDSTTDGGGGDGTQPGDGMYSACAIPQDCDFSPALCITIVDDMDMLLAGFCTETGCANPAVDCDASPNGIAVPVCVPVTVNMAADMACALQCTGNLACPAPMQCINVTGFGEICA